MEAYHIVDCEMDVLRRMRVGQPELSTYRQTEGASESLTKLD